MGIKLKRVKANDCGNNVPVNPGRVMMVDIDLKKERSNKPSVSASHAVLKAVCRLSGGKGIRRVETVEEFEHQIQ